MTASSEASRTWMAGIEKPPPVATEDCEDHDVSCVHSQGGHIVSVWVVNRVTDR